jgi:hypothetical protein
MTDVLQCPHCNLRFTTRSELDQHKALDHRQQTEEVPTKAEPDRTPVKPEERVAQATPPQKRGFLSRLFKRE